MLDAVNRLPRIMVVDDNEEAAMSLAILFRAAGFKVKVAFSGEEAVDLAARFQPDACVLDISMPGMNGYDLGRSLRQRTLGRKPILATVTGLSDGTHLDRAAEAGFDLHFTKPADPMAVVEQLEECLSR